MRLVISTIFSPLHSAILLHLNQRCPERAKESSQGKREARYPWLGLGWELRPEGAQEIVWHPYRVQSIRIHFQGWRASHLPLATFSDPCGVFIFHHLQGATN
jgi:hypothetical protein